MSVGTAVSAVGAVHDGVLIAVPGYGMGWMVIRGAYHRSLAGTVVELLRCLGAAFKLPVLSRRQVVGVWARRDTRRVLHEVPLPCWFVRTAG